MRREQALRRRLQSQQTLHEAVSAMKSLAAHHFRVARRALAAARAYQAGIDQALAAIGLPPPSLRRAPAAMLLIASDLGLCDGYNSQLVQKALEQRQTLDCGVLYCVGRRSIPRLERAGIAIARRYPAPTSVAGLTRLLLTLAQDVLGDHLAGKFSHLHVVSARFDGVGQFTPLCVQIWPPDPRQASGELRPSSYVSAERLWLVALREYLYIVLYQLLLDSLAAEHGARLIATGSAADWLQHRMLASQRQLSAIRREISTQELLDIVSGARHARGIHEWSND